MSAHFLGLLNSPICELILRMWIDFELKIQFVNTFLLLEKWVQNEEQFTALFALIFNFVNCHHKIVFTKRSGQFFLATVKRPSDGPLCILLTNVFYEIGLLPMWLSMNCSSFGPLYFSMYASEGAKMVTSFCRYSFAVGLFTSSCLNCKFGGTCTEYRADRKSHAQVRQCLGFCRADFWSSLAYASAEQKPKHCLTWDFLSALNM